MTEDFVREALHQWSPENSQLPEGEALPSAASQLVLPAVDGSAASPLLPTLEENEKAHIERALRQAGGRVSGPRGAAALLDVPRSTLQHRMRKLGIGG